jgi:chromosomal replication initiation ATPase DnaA
MTNRRNKQAALTALRTLNDKEPSEDLQAVILRLEREFQKDAITDSEKEMIIRNILPKVTGVQIKAIQGKCRQKHVAFARHSMRYLLKQYTSYPLKKIGSVTGGADHSTIIHSIREYANIIQQDDAERERYEMMVKEVEECLS